MGPVIVFEAVPFPKLCWWTTGRGGGVCPRGAECRFSHTPEESITSAVNTTTITTSTTTSTSTTSTTRTMVRTPVDDAAPCYWLYKMPQDEFEYKVPHPALLSSFISPSFSIISSMRLAESLVYNIVLDQN
jgi:hypothetical protein